jgi:phosphohistidine phosphatase
MGCVGFKFLNFKGGDKMALFLVQHGKNLPKDVDPEKGLSEDGISDVKRIANVAKDYGIQASEIYHSGKTRARQTAQIFADTIYCQGESRGISGMNPLDDVVEFYSEFRNELESNKNIMLVGHLPFMEKLSAYLVTGSEEKPVFKFQNGGIVCLEKEPDKQSWIIKWALMPTIG